MKSNQAIVVFLITFFINICIIWYFHDRFWWPPDEGQFAHLAERVCDGEVTGKTLEDNHPGYVNFINAGALKTFGKNFVSMRYPLIFITLLQSAALFLIFSRISLVAAAVVSVVSVTMGVINFFNPTHHWYCLFLALMTACHLVYRPQQTFLRLFIVGFLSVTMMLFQQLNGVFFSMGVLSFLIFEQQEKIKARSATLSRLVLGCFVSAILYYIAKVSDVSGAVLFGIWPLCILSLLLLRTTASDKRVGKVLLGFVAGGMIAIVPIVLYHLLHGSLLSWFNQITFRAFPTLGWEYLRDNHYVDYIAGGMSSLMNAKNFSDFLNGFYWVSLPCIGMINGFLTIICIIKGKDEKDPYLAIPFLASFYALISLFNQIPIYLYFTTIFSLSSLIWIVLKHYRPALNYVSVYVFLLCTVGVFYHAGQPLKDYGPFMYGKRIPLVPSAEQLPRNRLWISEDDLSIYTAVVNVIRDKTRPEEKLFVVPNDAELYFLSERKNPFSFFSTDHGVQTKEDLENVLKVLREDPPRIIINHPRDKRNTEFSKIILEYVKEHYNLIKQVDPYDIYQYPRE